ncbi:MAG: Ig-like domain-containing protein, partial [Ignavibacteria bacterium]|nr:Ig-like domain-containing protein [Ignavibacteria bacterium]
MKRIQKLIILFALVIQMFVGTPLQVFAVDVSSQIRTLDSTFTIRDSAKNVILPDINGVYSNIPRDSEIELYYSFEILDESEGEPVVEYSYLEGDTVVVQLPPQLSYVVPVSGLEIKDFDSGLTMGILTVASDGKATITFTDFVENNSGMQAWFRINGTFSEDTLGLPVNVPINLEFDGEIIQIGIQEPVLPDVTINTTKSGVYDINTNEIEWTISVTSSGLIYNLDLIDT